MVYHKSLLTPICFAKPVSTNPMWIGRNNGLKKLRAMIHKNRSLPKDLLIVSHFKRLTMRSVNSLVIAY